MPQPFLINSFDNRRQPFFPLLLLLLFRAPGCVFRDGVHRVFLRLLAFLFDACIDLPDHFLPPLLLVAFKKKVVQRERSARRYERPQYDQQKRFERRHGVST